MVEAQLIPVFAGNIEGKPVQLCNARDLHAFLEVGRDFSNWIKERIAEYGFIEGEDYSPNLANRSDGKVGKRRTDYHLTLDMAKELAMVERNEKGHQVRRYFIECERRQIEQIQLAEKTKALPPPRNGIPSELTSRINRRAWGLAHVAYENYRTRMMADAKVMDGSKTPEAWHPDEITQDVVQHMAVIANVLDGFAQKARDRGRDLAELVGMNYDSTVEQYFCPQQKTARIG